VRSNGSIHIRDLASLELAMKMLELLREKLQKRESG